MIVTGNGRVKIVLQDVVDQFNEVNEAATERDPERVHELEDSLREMVLTAIKDGDFQGESAKIVARLALSTRELCGGVRKFG